MKCQRAFDVDLAAVVRGESADADFLAHHPTCSDCATEVGVWRELDTMLRVGTPDSGSHPEPATLLAFIDAPTGLPDDVRSTVERHLATCRVCADEVRALGGFAAAHAAAPISAVGAPSLTSVAPAGKRLVRMVWNPAFAYAVVALLLVPLLRDQSADLTPVPALEAQRAEPAPAQEQPASRDEATTGAQPQERDRVANRLAKAAKPAPAPPPMAEPPARAARQRPDGAAEPALGGARPPAERRAAEGMMQAAPAAPARVAEAESARVADAAAPGAAAPAGAAADADQAETVRRMLDQLKKETAEDQIPPSARPRILQIGPGNPSFAAGREGNPAQLRVIPPKDIAPGPLEVAVRGRAGQPEVRMRVADRAEVIEVAIPPHWLVSGTYTVVLQPVDAAGSASARPTIMGFTIRAPEPAR